MDSAHHLIKGFATLRQNRLRQLLLSAIRYMKLPQGEYV